MDNNNLITPNNIINDKSSNDDFASAITVVSKSPTNNPSVFANSTKVVGHINNLKFHPDTVNMVMDKSTFEGYKKYMDTINPDEDLDYVRAKNQSWMEQVGKRTLDIAPNILIDLAQYIGQIYNLATQWGDDRTYNNEFIKTLDSWRDLGGWGTVYNKHPEKIFDFTDSASYINFIGSSVEAVAGFGMLGAGIARLFGKLGKVAKLAMNLGDLGTGYKGASTIAKSIDLGSQIGANMTVDYVMGANIAKEHYDKMYEEALSQLKFEQLQSKINKDKPLTDSDIEKEARHRASLGASTISQIVTLGMLPLNQTMFKAAFIPNKYLAKNEWLAENKISAESIEKGLEGNNLKSKLDNYSKYLESKAPEVKTTSTFRDITNEALQGAVKLGVIPAIAEAEGEKVATGKGNISDKLFSAETLMGVISGGLISAGQHYVMSELLKHKTYDENGNITGKETIKESTLKYKTIELNNAIENSKIDMKTTLEALNNLNKAKTDEERDIAKDDLFNVTLKRNVLDGTAENLAFMYDYISKLDNTKIVSEGKTQAQLEGFATDANDNDYVNRANQSLNEIKKYQDLYKDLMSKYNVTTNEQNVQIGEFMFRNKLDIDYNKNNLNKLDTLITNLQSEINEKQINKGETNNIDLTNSLIKRKALITEGRRISEEIQNILLDETNKTNKNETVNNKKELLDNLSKELNQIDEDINLHLENNRNESFKNKTIEYINNLKKLSDEIARLNNLKTKSYIKKKTKIIHTQMDELEKEYNSLKSKSDKDIIANTTISEMDLNRLQELQDARIRRSNMINEATKNFDKLLNTKYREEFVKKSLAIADEEIKSVYDKRLNEVHSLTQKINGTFIEKLKQLDDIETNYPDMRFAINAKRKQLYFENQINLNDRVNNLLKDSEPLKVEHKPNIETKEAEIELKNEIETKVQNNKTQEVESEKNITKENIQEDSKNIEVDTKDNKENTNIPDSSIPEDFHLSLRAFLNEIKNENIDKKAVEYKLRSFYKSIGDIRNNYKKGDIDSIYNSFNNMFTLYQDMNISKIKEDFSNLLKEYSSALSKKYTNDILKSLESKLKEDKVEEEDLVILSKLKDLSILIKQPEFTKEIEDLSKQIIEKLNIKDDNNNKDKIKEEIKNEVNEDNKEIETIISSKDINTQISDTINTDEIIIQDIKEDVDKLINNDTENTKIISAHNALAYKDTETIKIGKLYRNKSNYKDKFNDANDMFSMNVGDILEIQIDRKNDFYETFKSDINNIPLKIIHNGKSEFFIHTLDWVRDKEHVVEKIKDFDNLSSQIESIVNFRNKIITALGGLDSNNKIQIKIKDKGYGHLLRFKVEKDGNILYEDNKYGLPDKDRTIKDNFKNEPLLGITGKIGLFSYPYDKLNQQYNINDHVREIFKNKENKSEYEKEIYELARKGQLELIQNSLFQSSKNRKGSLVLILPTLVKNKFLAIRAYPRLLSDIKIDRLIDSKTKFEGNLLDNLKYIYDIFKKNNIEEVKKINKLLDDNGFSTYKLNTQYKQTFDKYLSHFVDVNTLNKLSESDYIFYNGAKINSEKSFPFIYKDSDGNYKIHKFESQNDLYVRTANTEVNGLNVNSKGQTICFEQPNILLDTNSIEVINKEKVEVKEPIKKVKEERPLDMNTTKEIGSDFKDDFFNPNDMSPSIIDNNKVLDKDFTIKTNDNITKSDNFKNWYGKDIEDNQRIFVNDKGEKFDLNEYEQTGKTPFNTKDIESKELSEDLIKEKKKEIDNLKKRCI